MAGNYDHSKSNLGEACGFTIENTTEFRDVLLKQFGSNASSPSKIVEVIEKEIEPKALAMLLVGSILATKRLEKVMDLIQSTGGLEAFKKVMEMSSFAEDETETIG